MVIVAIDEASCEKLGVRWPWPRWVFAKLINRLKESGAKAVGLNLTFTGLENGDDASSLELAEAMQNHGNVVIGTTFGEDNRLIFPSPVIAKAVRGYGYLEKIVDTDLVIRRAYRMTPLADSFPLALLKAYTHSAGDRLPAAQVDKSEIHDINFELEERDLKEISAWKILEGKYSPELISGKLALVGLTSAIFLDRHPTPLGMMPGVLIHANEFLSILSNHELHFMSRKSVFAWAWIIGLGVLALFLFKTVLLGTVGFVITIFGVSVIVQFFFTRDYVIEPFIFIFGAIFAMIFGVLANGLRLFLENRNLETNVIHDKLTGLYTYDFLLSRLATEWKRCKRMNMPISIAMTDLDRFKKINDTLGHETGNQMIQHAADVLKESARGYDVVARYGGDEFIILLWNAGPTEAAEYKKRLRTLYEKMAEGLKDPLLKQSSISIGVASLDPAHKDEQPLTPQALIEEADKRLLEDKESRRKSLL